MVIRVGREGGGGGISVEIDKFRNLSSLIVDLVVREIFLGVMKDRGLVKYKIKEEKGM